MNNDEIIFDEKNLMLVYNGKKIPVTRGKQALLCKKLFSVPVGTKINERTLSSAENTHWNYQIAFHTFNPLNHKFEAATGIKKFIKYKTGDIWVELAS